MKNSLDILKLLLTFNVVAIHLDVQYVSDKLFLFAKLAVPIFFIISGYLLYRKYITKGLKEQVIKLIRLYVIWTLIYIPLTIIGLNRGYLCEKGVFHALVVGTFIMGGNYMSWPLWYLYALIGSTIMVGIFKHLKCNIEIIVVIGIVISVLGYYFESIHNNQMMNFPTWIYSIVNVYYSYFCTTRNFFFFGFPCLTFGLIIAKYEELLLKNKYIFIIILPFAIWLYINDFILTKIVVSAIVIIITLSVNNLPDNSKVYLNLRRIGVLVYFSHMYFIFFVTELWNLRFLANFIIVSSLVTIFACFLLFLMNKKNMGFLKKIISS